MTPDKPDPNLARLRAIEADIRSGRLEAAAASVEAYKRRTPTDPRVYYLEAMLASATGDVVRELACLQHAVDRAPESAMAHRQLAYALHRHDRLADAVAAANRSVALHPNDLSLLEMAFRYNRELGDLATAEDHLRAAWALVPENKQVQQDLISCVIARGRFSDAIELCQAALRENPDDVLALLGAGDALIRLGRLREAAAYLEQAATLAPENASLHFYLAIAHGETPSTQPPETVMALFDEYAGRFDKHLVGELKYRVPRIVADTIKARSPMLDVDILDLGCGTGLVGAYLMQRPRRLVGIDLSQRMLAQAARHNTYTQLRAGELLAELRDSPAEAYDYVIAADVFIYVGDLREVIPAIHYVLRKSGVLIFSCEAADANEGDLILRPTRRYAHSRSSVKALCHSAGFARCQIDDIDLRIDGTLTLPGFVVIAEMT